MQTAGLPPRTGTDTSRWVLKDLHIVLLALIIPLFVVTWGYSSANEVRYYLLRVQQWAFMDAHRIYLEDLGVHAPMGFHFHGLDVSHHQKEIDWKAVSRASIGDKRLSFTFIKATEGRTHQDSRFRYNWEQARKAGLLRGAYHYFSPYSDPKEQARNFVRHVKLRKGDLPPILDVEVTGGLSAQELQTRVQRWLDIVESYYQVRPILYTGHKFYHLYLSGSFKQYPIWIAHYNRPYTELEYNRPWTFWQYTEQAKLPGIQGAVDLNVFSGTYDDLMLLRLK